MPKIGAYGAVCIFMHWETGGCHHAPHFHAEYQGQKVSVAIPSLRFLGGTMDHTPEKEVRKWARKRKGALMKEWKLAREHKPLPWID